jgi:hypothetical protein
MALNPEDRFLRTGNLAEILKQEKSFSLDKSYIPMEKKSAASPYRSTDIPTWSEGKKKDGKLWLIVTLAVLGSLFMLAVISKGIKNWPSEESNIEAEYDSMPETSQLPVELPPPPVPPPPPPLPPHITKEKHPSPPKD